MSSGQRRTVLCGEFGHSGPDAPEVVLKSASSQAVLCCQVQQRVSSSQGPECPRNWIRLCQQGTGKRFQIRLNLFFSLIVKFYLKHVFLSG